MQMRIFAEPWRIPIILALAGLLTLASVSAVRTNEIVVDDGDVAGLIVAIDDANSTGDSITLAGNGVYLLEGAHNTTDGDNGLPVISGNVHIQGNGATIRRVSEQEIRIFDIAPGGELHLDDVRVQDGQVSQQLRLTGGGIRNAGTLTMTDSTVSGGRASAGGGIYSDGTATLNRSVVSNNSAHEGGGILNGGTMTLIDSTLVSNDGGLGGGLYTWGETVLTRSTVSGNRAGPGGGIFAAGSTLTIINGTISENTAANSGGGIFSDTAAVTLLNASVSANHAGLRDPFAGGGILNSGGSLTTTNTLVAKNTATADTGVDIAGTVTNDGGYNLIGDGSDMDGLVQGQNGNLVGDGANPIDPKLDALGDNGGPTLTMALLPGSPAIMAANNAECPDTDQRSEPRFEGGICDIGAFETSYKAPSITGVPSETMVIEGNTRGGATIDLDALGMTILARDYAGNELAIVCTPGFVDLSTALVPSTEVTCVSDGDNLNNSASGAFMVTVVDTTAPAFPDGLENQTLIATGPSGARVLWSPAEDVVDSDPVMACMLEDGTPIESGDVVPAGTVEVTCTATDASGNESETTSFVVTVLGAEDLLRALIDNLGTMDVHRGVKEPSLATLNAAQRSLERGDETATCNNLGAFTTFVAALNGKRLSDPQADHLTDAAVRIRIVLGCWQ